MEANFAVLTRAAAVGNLPRREQGLPRGVKRPDDSASESPPHSVLRSSRTRFCAHGIARMREWMQTDARTCSAVLAAGGIRVLTRCLPLFLSAETGAAHKVSSAARALMLVRFPEHRPPGHMSLIGPADVVFHGAHLEGVLLARGALLLPFEWGAFVSDTRGKCGSSVRSRSLPAISAGLRSPGGGAQIRGPASSRLTGALFSMYRKQCELGADLLPKDVSSTPNVGFSGGEPAAQRGPLMKSRSR